MAAVLGFRNMTGLTAVLRDAAEVQGERPFVLAGDEVVSFAELERRVERCARGLAGRGIVAGDRIAVAGLNTVDWLTVLFAAARVGAPLVTLNVRYRETELLYMLGDSGARLVVTEAAAGGFDLRGLYAQLSPRLPNLESVLFFGTAGPDGFDALLADERAGAPVEPGAIGDDTPAVILYTSGTTGRPKGAVLTHGSLMAAACAQRERQGTSAEDVLLAALPFNHVGGLTCSVLHALAAGARLALLPAFSPAAALDAVSRHGVTVLMCVPTMYVLLLAELAKSEHDVSSVRIATVGGANVDPTLARAIADGFPAARLQTIYGLSEASGGCVMSAPDDDLATVSATLGTPLTGVDVRVVDPATDTDVPDGTDGELHVRGRLLAAGYWNSPPGTEDTFRDGWLATGDMVTRRPDGHLVLRGRRKEMFLQGGFNVYPVEVENVLTAHPAVALAAGIGVPDDVLGEVGLYFVVPREAADPPSESDLLDWCRERLADYKVPRSIRLREQLPTTPAGKIAKAQLRRELGIA